MDVVDFPKLTPTPIHRSGIETWLQFHADMPLRWIAGPAGSGKTTAAHLYARRSPNDCRYVRLHAGSTIATLAEALGRAFAAPVDPQRIANAFPSDVRLELVIDEIDNAGEDARLVLAALPNQIPPNVTLIYLSRSRRVIDLVSLVTQGLAVVMDRPLLALTVREATELCEALGIAASATDINQLVHATEGWAFALTGTLRDAAFESRGLRGAFARWHERHARLIRHLVERSLLELSPAERDAAERIYAGQEAVNAPAYAQLHDCGLLVSFSDAELRPLRGIASVATRPAYAPAPVSVPTATIAMFGEFRMEIDGRRIEWFRRRDRQLIAFVALQPQATASRALVLQTFWPNAEPHLAAQSLRTACSTIRRAIAQCVGYDRVDHYFTVGRELRLNTDHVSVSSQRLQAHIEAGEEAFASGDVTAARGHYLAACRMYTARLLDGEGNEPWLAAPAETFAQMIAVAAERSVTIRHHQSDGALPLQPVLRFSN